MESIAVFILLTTAQTLGKQQWYLLPLPLFKLYLTNIHHKIVVLFGSWFDVNLQNIPLFKKPIASGLFNMCTTITNTEIKFYNKEINISPTINWPKVEQYK